MVRLDILSDPICPWCYIGKLRLDRALEARPTHPLAIEWHPFQLNPDMPREGMDRAAYLAAKFGGAEGAAQAYRAVRDAAAETGIEIDFDAIPRVPNTLDAHRLIHWAGIEQRQTAAVSALFRAYFVDHRDIGNREVLCDIADGLDLDAAMIARLLDSDADEADIRARDAHSREMGITGVPTFIVGQRHAVPGAQPTDLWIKVLDEMMAEGAGEDPQ
ncbi:DsbA family oxidoreductase [Wenxinia saemankumensis]|uniref:Predicted dithiol-disulfide isomerase, DsbA family n=1 Tax=Wenxinia saemankumensis TaxID=1447782 RepID=A0A1M6A6E8_9RHOB|nr:DsbA family oxidoreductase [Wenxinia saemankumensis]SHI32016.1 Predicted dithiol-disulfide isomerase, DsbA family [Wenxinia saemankumensis]